MDSRVEWPSVVLCRVDLSSSEPRRPLPLSRDRPVVISHFRPFATELISRSVTAQITLKL